MAETTLQEVADWPAGIYQLETNDLVLGGPTGIANLQPRQLVNRTVWLRQKVEAAVADLDSLLAALAAHAAGRDHPAATTTQIGFVELATVAEATTGTDTTRAVTPAGLAAAIATIPAVPAASDSVAGRVELATVAEATTGTDTTRAVTPAGLAAAIAEIHIPATPDLTPYARLATVQDWTALQSCTVTVLAEADTIAWDLAHAQMAEVTISASRTLALPINMRAGARVELTVVHGAAGTTLSFAPGYTGITGLALSTTAGAVDVLTWRCTGASMRLVSVVLNVGV